MIINEEKYYKDLSGSYHPKNEVYGYAYEMAILACLTGGEEPIRSWIDSVAWTAELLTGEDRDSFYGSLAGLGAGAKVSTKYH